MEKDYDDVEIKRVFACEHNEELDDVMQGIVEKIRFMLNKAKFGKDDLKMAESMLGFVSVHIPDELYPWRIDVLKNQLWKCIDRTVPKKIYDAKKSNYVNNFLWHPDF